MDRVLLIDDDADLCGLLMEYLVPEGFEIEVAHDGETGLRKALLGAYDLIVLDVMLPLLSGFEVLRRLRPLDDTPVVMLTARGEHADRIAGLETGADDYLSKPFNARELLARMRAILKRTRQGRTEPPAAGHAGRPRVGDVEMNLGARLVFRSGARVGLTAVEFDLLERLLLRAGQVVTREELTREVLGRPPLPFDRSLDVHISNVRRKLGRAASGRSRIETVRGVGYLYVLPEGGGG